MRRAAVAVRGDPSRLRTRRMTPRRSEPLRRWRRAGRQSAPALPDAPARAPASRRRRPPRPRSRSPRPPRASRRAVAVDRHAPRDHRSTSMRRRAGHREPAIAARPTLSATPVVATGHSLTDATAPAAAIRSPPAGADATLRSRERLRPPAPTSRSALATAAPMSARRSRHAPQRTRRRHRSST